jgi:hypothetical protein
MKFEHLSETGTLPKNVLYFQVLNLYFDITIKFAMSPFLSGKKILAIQYDVGIGMFVCLCVFRIRSPKKLSLTQMLLVLFLCKKKSYLINSLIRSSFCITCLHFTITEATPLN